MGRPAQLQPEKRSRQGRHLLFFNTKRLEIGGSRQIFCPTLAFARFFFGVTCAVVRKVYWGELERAPHRRVGLGFCHSRYIYIGIGGPTAIFEPAPFLQPCTFFWPDLVDRKPPHRAAHNAHTDAQYKATEPRLYCAHTDARPAYLRPAKST